jgi:exopolyphosphatase/guanosine-5'-triphosphate,3'-diphosphate pyrophosphatase
MIYLDVDISFEEEKRTVVTTPAENKPIVEEKAPSSKAQLRRMRAEERFLAAAVHKEWERRGAVDVGSGTTKICIADVDLQTNKIIRVVLEKQFAIPYQAYVEADGCFGESIRSFGINTFKEILEIFEEQGVEKIVAVATEAFRRAANGIAFAEEVQAIGLPLQVISQEEEGAIGFYSALSSLDQRASSMLVWDIGTGSFQISVENPIDEIIVYMQSFGSVPFKNYIIHNIQGKDLAVEQSPNPISEEDWKKADAFAREIGRKAFPLIKDKIKTVSGVVLGIGRLFSNSIGSISDNPEVISRKDLRDYIRKCLNKTDAELKDSYANVNVSNAILVLGVMKALHIHEIDIVNTTSTKGILTYPEYWESQGMECVAT